MSVKNSTRTETDSMGSVEVPKNAYHGAFTVRAQNNFQISGIHSPIAFKNALARVKWAAAKTNCKLGGIDKKHEQAISQACEEFINGKFDTEFTLDVFQAGAGTSYNMNANEIIANRANEILGGTKGKYEHIHPNNHVNQAQSTNDVIPTATRIATLSLLPGLLGELKKLAKEFEKKAKEEKNTLKVGRTHLMDAVPITLGQEFDAYKEALEKSGKMVERQSKDLSELGIGGTALGTGLNSDPGYKKLMVENLSKLTGLKLTSGKNLTEMANNMNAFMNFSGALRSLATNLLNISNDLKLMNMGPKAGISEITLPEVQPGSSIMPGKVNPSIPECLEMICFQVLGNDRTIELAAQRSQFDLNVMCPVIMYNLLQSMEIITNGMRMLRTFSIEGIQVNRKHIKQIFEGSVCTATALAPHIGYNATADVVKTALKKGITIKEEVRSRKLMPDKELEKILSVEATTKPQKTRVKVGSG